MMASRFFSLALLCAFSMTGVALAAPLHLTLLRVAVTPATFYFLAYRIVDVRLACGIGVTRVTSVRRSGRTVDRSPSLSTDYTCSTTSSARTLDTASLSPVLATLAGGPTGGWLSAT
jgi:hypothetical protein